MARLPIQDPQTATGTVKETFDGLRKGLGMVPNMARVMGNSPAVLQAWTQFNRALGSATLSPPIREQIALLTAESNQCTYCLSAHTALGKMAGLTPPQMIAARRGESSDARAEAALVFAQTVIDNRGGIGDADVQAVRNAGFSDAEIAEIAAAVALNFFTNLFNRAFDVDVDFPRVEPHHTATVR